MNKRDFTDLVLKHSEEISELRSSTAQMLLLWKIVGAAALVLLGSWLTAY